MLPINRLLSRDLVLRLAHWATTLTNAQLLRVCILIGAVGIALWLIADGARLRMPRARGLAQEFPKFQQWLLCRDS